MSGAQYDILATGSMDKDLTGNPEMTYWRSTYKRCTRFSVDSYSQPFSTQTNFGQEAQILCNRVGDMIWHMYLHVTLPGIVACDSRTENCAGLAPGNQFPTFSDGTSCNPCSKQDEASLLEYLPASYSTMSATEKAQALKDAKDVMLRERYGAGRELDCCVEGEQECPDEICPELGDTWAHYCQDWPFHDRPLQAHHRRPAGRAAVGPLHVLLGGAHGQGRTASH